MGLWNGVDRFALLPGSKNTIVLNIVDDELLFGLTAGGFAGTAEACVSTGRVVGDVDNKVSERADVGIVLRAKKDVPMRGLIANVEIDEEEILGMGREFGGGMGSCL